MTMIGVIPICPKCNAEIKGVSFRYDKGERLGPFTAVTFCCPSCRVALSVVLLSAEDAKQLASVN
jgi:hypothetical protein